MVKTGIAKRFGALADDAANKAISAGLQVKLPSDVQMDVVQNLTAAIADGDPGAFTRFFETRFTRMLSEARRASGRDESFCLDVVQDAMMRVIRSIRPMHTEADLHRWLRAVVQSCAYDRLRSESRRHRREGHAGPAAATSQTTRSQLAWLEEQLRTLDDHQLDLLLMRHRFGWTLQQIGAAVGMKPGAVDGRLRRIVQMLRRRAQRSSADLREPDHE